MTNTPIEEAVARALCEAEIRRVRRWDTDPAELEAMMPASVDYSWPDCVYDARAAIEAYRASMPNATRVEELEGALRGILWAADRIAAAPNGNEDWDELRTARRQARKALGDIS